MSRRAAVVLWWGAEIRLLTPEDRLVPVEVKGRAGPAAGIIGAMELECPRAPLRVAYHQDSLEVHSVGCPQAGRARLRGILGAEYPGLNSAGAVWGVDEVRETPEGGNTTQLYLDNGTGVPDLVDSAEKAGIRLEGVWPLATLVEAACGRDRFVAIVAVGSRSLVSAVGALGNRFVRFQEAQGGRLEEDAKAGLSLFEGTEAPVGLLVAEEDGEFLRQWFREVPVSESSVAQFLGAARALKAGSASNLAPRKPFFARRPKAAPIVALAGVALLAASAWSIRESNVRNELRRRNAAVAQGEQAEFEKLLEGRRRIKADMDKIRRELDSMWTPRQDAWELLQALSRATPPSIYLTGLEIESGRFRIEGCAEGSQGPAAVAEYRLRLSARGMPWRLVDPLPGKAGVVSLPTSSPSPSPLEFTVNGVFTATGRDPSG